MAKFRLVPVDDPDEISARESVARGAAQSVASSVAGLPDLALRALNFSPLLFAATRGQRPGILAPETIQRASDALPQVRPETLVAGVEALANSRGPGFQGGLAQRFRTAQDRQIEALVQNPAAARTGEVLGDVGQLVAGRLPGSRRIRAAEEALMTNRVRLTMQPGALALAENVINSKGARTLARGAGRSLEAGFESAVLETLQGGDPLEVAGFAAGGQLAGSALLQSTKGILSGGPMKSGVKLGIAAMGAGSIIQMMKSATPGGRDRILESAETGFDKVMFAMFLGALSGTAGAGRVRSGAVARNFPKFGDAIAAAPRAATISLVNDWVRADERGQGETLERVLLQQAQDPDFFGPAARRRIERAISDESVSLLDTINQLAASDPRFAQKLELAGAQAAGAVSAAEAHGREVRRKLKLIPLTEESGD